MRARPAGLLVILFLVPGCPHGTAPPADDWAGTPRFARVERLDAPLGEGDLWDGRAGDWVLRNERLAVVVRDVGRRGGFAQNGGVIVDAAPAGGEDRLREIFTYLDDTFPRQAVYETLEAMEDSAGAALVARGADGDAPGLRVETRYLLAPGTSALRILTTITNTGPDTVAQYELGDAIQWGRAAPYAPGPGRALHGHRGPVPFLVAADGGTAYGWAAPGGNLHGPHGAAWSDPIVRTVTLEPGASATYERHLYVGPGFEADAARWARALRGEDTGTFHASVKGDHGHAVEGAVVEARDATGSVALGRTGAEGDVRLDLPPVPVTVTAWHPRRGSAAPEPLRVQAHHEKHHTFRLPEPARLRLSSRDAAGRPSPARWTFQGRDGTPDPDLGSDLASGAGRTVSSGSGEVDAGIPAGSYRVTASRGPFFEAWQADLTVEAGESRALDATLTRLPAPEGWIGADLHVHAVPSVDSNVSLADRLVSAAAEGVDWFVAADHGARTDYEAARPGLVLAAPVGVIVGEEVTTPRQGHLSAYPLPRRPAEPGAGALDATRLPPRALSELLRAEGPGVLVQVNHPRTGHDGLFDRLGFRPDSLAADSAGSALPLDFNALEIHSTRGHDRPEAAWEDWLGLLRAGHLVTAVGNSDSHRLAGDVIGYPRNVLIPDAATTDWSAEEVTRAVRAGRVVVTNGPLVRFTVNGAEVGSTVIASPGTVSAHITVWAGSWVDVRRVTLYVNGEVEARFPVPEGGGALRFDETIDVPLRGSAFLLVRVEGDRPLEPLLPPQPGAPGNGPWTPLAVTNPIRVEIQSASR